MGGSHYENKGYQGLRRVEGFSDPQEKDEQRHQACGKSRDAMTSSLNALNNATGFLIADPSSCGSSNPAILILLAVVAVEKC
jgi:hypothetical protein